MKLTKKTNFAVGFQFVKIGEDITNVLATVLETMKADSDLSNFSLNSISVSNPGSTGSEVVVVFAKNPANE